MHGPVKIGRMEFFSSNGFTRWTRDAKKTIGNYSNILIGLKKTFEQAIHEEIIYVSNTRQDLAKFRHFRIEIRNRAIRPILNGFG